MKTCFEKSADSRRANCPETKSWPLGHAIWLAVLCLALWAVGPRASAQMPPHLDATLKQVADRRCVSCHEKGIPRKFSTRVNHPEKNSFLLAPLASEGGGTQKCREPVFASTTDPD